MELEEMKALWGEMSNEMEKQKKLTSSLIIKMTESSYKNKLNRVLVPEALASVVCFAMAFFILTNLHKLDTWYLSVCGIVCLLVLIINPVLSLKSVFSIRSLNISANNYKQTLSEYSKRKKQFVFIQKLNICLAAIVMIVVLPLMVKLIDGIDMFKQGNLWYWYVILFPFFYYFANWVFKGYVKAAAAAGNILTTLHPPQGGNRTCPLPQKSIFRTLW